MSAGHESATLAFMLAKEDMGNPGTRLRRELPSGQGVFETLF